MTATHPQAAPATSISPAAVPANRHIDIDEAVDPGAMDTVKVAIALRTPELCQFWCVQKPPSNSQQDGDNSDKDEGKTEQIGKRHLGQESVDLLIEGRHALEQPMHRLPGPQSHGRAQVGLFQKQKQTYGNDQKPKQLHSENAQEVTGATLSMNSPAPDKILFIHHACCAPLAQCRQQNAGRIRSPRDEWTRNDAEQ